MLIVGYYVWPMGLLHVQEIVSWGLPVCRT